MKRSKTRKQHKGGSPGGEISYTPWHGKYGSPGGEISYTGDDKLEYYIDSVGKPWHGKYLTEEDTRRLYPDNFDEVWGRRFQGHGRRRGTKDPDYVHTAASAAPKVKHKWGDKRLTDDGL